MGQSSRLKRELRDQIGQRRREHEKNYRHVAMLHEVVRVLDNMKAENCDYPEYEDLRLLIRHHLRRQG